SVRLRASVLFGDTAVNAATSSKLEAGLLCRAAGIRRIGVGFADGNRDVDFDLRWPDHVYTGRHVPRHSVPLESPDRDVSHYAVHGAGSDRRSDLRGSVAAIGDGNLQRGEAVGQGFDRRAEP